MAELSKGVRTALGRYWSEIIGGAANKESTSAIFGRIRARAAELGLPSVGVGASDISKLRGYASAMVRAQTTLASTDPTRAVTAAVIAETPWSRSLTERNTLPIYNVQFQHTVQLDDGSTVTKWHTISIPGVLPATVGELQARVAGEAQLMAAYGGDAQSGTPHGVSLGVSDLMVTAV